MSETTLPKPLAAYVGLVVATLEDARGTDRSAAAQVAHLPLAAAVQLLTARQRYDQLAVQGDVITDAVVGIVRQRFGSGADEADAWIGEQFASLRTSKGPNGGSKFERIAEEFETLIEDTLVDPLEEAAERLAEQQAAADEAAFAPATPPKVVKSKPAVVKPKPAVAKAKPKAKTTPAKTTPAKAVRPAKAVVQPTPAPEPTPAQEPAPAPTPRKQLDSFSVAPGIGTAAGGLKSAGELPLKDFDHMSGPQLRGRLRTLDRVQLVQLLDYERAHAHRVGIVVMLENRLTKLNATN